MGSKQKRIVLRGWGGTLLLCLLKPDAVYMAADSRYAGLHAPLADTAQKMVMFGPSALCGFSGLLRFTRMSFDSRQEEILDSATFELPAIVSELASSRPQLSAGDVAEAFAGAVQNAVAPVWQKFATGLNEPFGRAGARSNRLAELIYLDRSPDGDVSFFVLELRHSNHRSRGFTYESHLEKPSIKRQFFGRVADTSVHWRGMKSCLAGESTLNPAEFQEHPVKAIIEAFASAQNTQRCKSAIGGPVDIGSIDASGRRWIQTKQA